MSVAPYVTRVEYSYCDGWLQLGAIWVSRRPLFDLRTGLSSRHTYREAQAAVARLGARLPTPAEIDAIRDDALAAGGCILAPICLPDLAQQHAAGIFRGHYPSDEDGEAAHEAAVQVLRSANMAGEEYVRYHDNAIDAALEACGWQGDRAVMNDGKWYADGAPDGRAWLKGWWTGHSYIQHGPSGPHDPGPHSADGSRDYGTKTMAVRDTAPEAA